VTVLIIGMSMVAILLILVTIAVTSVAIARTRLIDAADGAALAAANAFDSGTYQVEGISDAVPVSDATVRAASVDHLASLTLPHGIAGWAIEPGTGSPDGRTAVVVLTGRVAVPFADVVGSDATIALTVESRARAALR